MESGFQSDHQVPSLVRPVRAQPEYSITFTLAVTDARALWTAAAARLLVAPDMTLADVLDLIGPREDPSIAECIMTLARPATPVGCVLDDFWIDALRSVSPRSDADVAASPLRPTLSEVLLPRRPAAPSRKAPQLQLCADPAANPARAN